MDNEIIIAIISGFGTIASGIFGAILGRNKSAENANVKLHKEQLEKLYAPLMEYFIFQSGKLSVYQKISITKLLSQNHAIAAPSLISAWKSVLSNEENSELRFKKSLQSNYHWVKKKLGYPYDRESINLKYLPSKGANILIYIIALAFSVFILLLSLYFMKHSEAVLIKAEFTVIYILSTGGAFWSISKLFNESIHL